MNEKMEEVGATCEVEAKQESSLTQLEQSIERLEKQTIELVEQALSTELKIRQKGCPDIASALSNDKNMDAPKNRFEQLSSDIASISTKLNQVNAYLNDIRIAIE